MHDSFPNMLAGNGARVKFKGAPGKRSETFA